MKNFLVVQRDKKDWDIYATMTRLFKIRSYGNNFSALMGCQESTIHIDKEYPTNEIEKAIGYAFKILNDYQGDN